MFQRRTRTGAWLNGQPLRVNDVPDLQHSLLVTGFPYDMWETPNNNIANFLKFSKCSQGVRRRLGSAAIDLLMWLVGVWMVIGKSQSTVGHCRGRADCARSGGRVTKLTGVDEYMTPPYDVVASNPALHPHMLEVLHSTVEFHIKG